MQGHSMCDSECWPPGQREEPAVCHIIKWSPQMQQQTPYGMASGKHWLEAQQNHL